MDTRGRYYKARLIVQRVRGAAFDLIVSRLVEDEAFGAGLEDDAREHKARQFAQIAATAMTDACQMIYLRDDKQLLMKG